MKKLPTLKSTINAYILAAESIGLSKRTQAIQLTKIFADHNINIDMIEHDIYAPGDIDAPTAIGSSDKHIDKQANTKALTKTATQLLKDSHTTLSAKKLNEILIKKGVMANRVRQTNKPTKYPRQYKVLIGKGLEYGDNVKVNAGNTESTPHFYPEKFDLLLQKAMKNSPF